MNVYDFDKTIYRNDSTRDFYLYCIKRYPGVLIYAPSAILAALKYCLKIYTKTEMKEVFYRFLNAVPNVDSEVKAFWKKHKSGIHQWYKNNRKDTDIIISASPEFLLKDFCESELGVTLLASRVDKLTGEYTGENCYGEEKVVRFYEYINKPYVSSDTPLDAPVIDNFYSDSLSDTPLARLSTRAFLVNGENLTPWMSFSSGK